MSLHFDRRRAGREPIGRRARWLVLALLAFLALGVVESPAALGALPSRSGPDGLPPAPPTIGPQIVGGTAVPNGKYPFQAALLIQSGGTNDFERQFCGGSLISPDRVLTAAHCVDFFGPGSGQLPLAELRVVVGRTVLTSTQGERRTATRITIHPRWQPSTFEYDAAVITLSKPVRGIRPVRPVAPGFGGLERAGAAVIASGWGNTLAQPVGSSGGTAFPNRLREVTVPIVSSRECAAALTFDGVHYLYPSTMLCAGRAGRDSCQGDSGGPLFVKSLGGQFVQVGVTSWGVGCAAAGYPGVYTKLSNRSIGRFVMTAGWPLRS